MCFAGTSGTNGAGVALAIMGTRDAGTRSFRTATRLEPSARSRVPVTSTTAVRPSPARRTTREPGTGPDAAGFRDTVQPFLTAHCVRCHNAKKAEGKLDLTKLGADLAAGRSADEWQAVADRITAGEMPPEGAEQPDPAAAKAVTGWVERELAKAGKTAATRSGGLRTGNHVPHHLLFGPGAGTAPLDNPPRVWRVSPFIYAEAAKAFKGLTLAQPFALPPGDGFKDQTATGGLHVSTTAQLMRNGILYFTTLKDPEKGRVTAVDVAKGSATVVYDATDLGDLANPNGVALSADGKFLYVGVSNYKDKKKSGIYRFPVRGDGSVDVAAGKDKKWADVAGPDGIAVAPDGHVYATAGAVVVVLSPEGKKVGEVKIPKGSGTNLCFGGADGRTLFVTTNTALYAADPK